MGLIFLPWTQIFLDHNLVVAVRSLTCSALVLGALFGLFALSQRLFGGDDFDDYNGGW